MSHWIKMESDFDMTDLTDELIRKTLKHMRKTFM